MTSGTPPSRARLAAAAARGYSNVVRPVAQWSARDSQPEPTLAPSESVPSLLWRALVSKSDVGGVASPLARVTAEEHTDAEGADGTDVEKTMYTSPVAAKK